jgi:hypothetical protein
VHDETHSRLRRQDDEGDASGDGGDGDAASDEADEAVAVVLVVFDRGFVDLEVTVRPRTS